MRNLKITAILIVVIALLCGVIFYISNKKSGNVVSEKKVETIAKEVYFKFDKTYSMLRSATLSGKIEACDSIESKYKDDCYAGIAASQGEVKYCSWIKDLNKKTICEQLFDVQKIYKQGVLSKCYELSDSMMVRECLGLFINSFSDASECNKLREGSSSCIEQITRVRAIELRSTTTCQDLSDEGAIACTKAVLQISGDKDQDGLIDSKEQSFGADQDNPDSDNDGLKDGEEVFKYRTNPNNPDTDGDGHNDGEEIRQGFNPSGKGSLK